jgi:2-polyprenyl-3-methyl-5-hydroxy-6-metoxy-1,4-benzoquinol methylase
MRAAAIGFLHNHAPKFAVKRLREGHTIVQRENTREERWKSEAMFFDEWATKAAQHITQIDPLALKRYSPPLRRRFNKEFRFLLMGNLKGKCLLDVGCGDGSNAVMLAKLGASVTGIDISPRAIDLAEKRAEINGVNGLVHFYCSQLEAAELPQNSFDIIWGDAILHHLIAELDMNVRKLREWAKPNALLVFGEPINFNNALRKFRFMLPVKTDATPDERPLESADVEILRRHIPDLQVRAFSLFGRLDRFILLRSNYERSAWPRRAFSNSLAVLDYLLLSLPGIDQLGGTAVMYGHPKKP